MKSKRNPSWDALTVAAVILALALTIAIRPGGVHAPRTAFMLAFLRAFDNAPELAVMITALDPHIRGVRSHRRRREHRSVVGLNYKIATRYGSGIIESERCEHAHHQMTFKPVCLATLRTATDPSMLGDGHAAIAIDPQVLVTCVQSDDLVAESGGDLGIELGGCLHRRP